MHICRRLRWPDTVHPATGEAPFLTVCGYHMFFNGSSYKLARRLRSLVDHEMAGMQTKNKLRIIHAKVQKQLEGAYEMSRQRYDKRTRMLLVKPGQEVFRRNFVLSDFSKSFNAKFALKFI